MPVQRGYSRPVDTTPRHHDMEAAFGRCLEDFRVGDTFRHWPAKTITESDNNLFCLLTRNPHPLHSDAEYAAGQQHGRILVVGTLTFSLVVGMSVPDISGKAVANLDYEAVRHEGPVFVGDTIRAETEVLEARRSASNPDRGWSSSRPGPSTSAGSGC